MYKNILILVLVLTTGLLYNLYDKTSKKKDNYKIRIDTLGKQNNNLYNNLNESKLNNDEKDFYLNLVSKYSNKLYFKKIEKSKLIIDKKNYNFKKFQTFYLKTSKFPNSSGNAYLGYKNNSLFLVSGDGIFLNIDFEEFNNDEFDATVIKTNIKDLIKYEKFYNKSPFGIKDVLVHEDLLFVSYSNEIKKDCFNTSIIFAKINNKFLEFKEFFNPQNCISTKNKFGSFTPHSAGGRMDTFDKKNIIFTTGEYGYAIHAQDKKNIFGKIIKINIDNNKTKILSMGHRNAQGLIFDKKNNLIINTEHGPQGGDEINFNYIEENKIKNFGWPISSYGEHYGFTKRDDNHILYKKAPLYKNHIDYGFEEPFKYFTPSIAISQIVEISEFIETKNKFYIIGALGRKNTLNQMSIHFMEIDGKEIKSYDVLEINERVRDIIYIKELKKIILFLETTGSIAIIDKV
jgi:hypothetical protein